MHYLSLVINATVHDRSLHQFPQGVYRNIYAVGAKRCQKMLMKLMQQLNLGNNQLMAWVGVVRSYG